MCVRLSVNMTVSECLSVVFVGGRVKELSMSIKHFLLCVSFAQFIQLHKKKRKLFQETFANICEIDVKQINAYKHVVIL